MDRPVLQCAAVMGALGACFAVWAQTPAAERGRSIAATCAGCHGTAGVSSAGMARLAGMPRDQLRRTLLEFKAGSRPGTVMPQLAKGYTEAQIDALAAWFAAQADR